MAKASLPKGDGAKPQRLMVRLNIASLGPADQPTEPRPDDKAHPTRAKVSLHSGPPMLRHQPQPAQRSRPNGRPRGKATVPSLSLPRQSASGGSNRKLSFHTIDSPYPRSYEQQPGEEMRLCVGTDQDDTNPVCTHSTCHGSS